MCQFGMDESGTLARVAGRRRRASITENPARDWFWSFESGDLLLVNRAACFCFIVGFSSHMHLDQGFQDRMLALNNRRDG